MTQPKAHVFRRTREQVTTPPVEESKPSGKGRPTPSRKEAEAAAKARAKPPRTRRGQVAAQRAIKGESISNISTYIGREAQLLNDARQRSRVGFRQLRRES